ncbi:MAG: hypothetical protein HYZ28_14895 [Myxococcales bacterium]|nr:hypothetical protein [Myxococcales bacterium]
MKKLLAVVAVSLALLGTLAVSSQVSAEPDGPPTADEAAVRARIDSRLHQVLAATIARRAQVPSP